MNNNLSELEMAKKRNHKIMITDEAINKIPRIRYRDIPESEYDNLWDLAKNVLKISKEEKYDLKKAIALFNEAVDKNNKAEKLKDLQNAADYFLKNCYNAGIGYDNR